MMGRAEKKERIDGGVWAGEAGRERGRYDGITVNREITG